MGEVFPNAFLLGFGLETVGELAQIYVIDGLGPGGDHRGAEVANAFWWSLVYLVEPK